MNGKRLLVTNVLALLALAAVIFVPDPSPNDLATAGTVSKLSNTQYLLTYSPDKAVVSSVERSEKTAVFH